MYLKEPREYVILVDERDNELGIEEKIEAHRRGLRHRAFSILLFREFANGMEICMQRRAFNKYHSGGLWTNTCCSHPRHNENLETAAHRRLWEEMGMTARLWHVGQFHYISRFENGLIENEIDHVFVGSSSINTPSFNKEEIVETAWWSLQKVENKLKKETTLFTPWFAQVFELATMNMEFVKKMVLTYP